MKKKKYTKIWYTHIPLFTCPYFVALCTSEKQHTIALNSADIPAHRRVEFPSDDFGFAATHFFSPDNTILVCLSAKGQKQKPSRIAASLVHEAVHIWQHCKKFYGEDPAGEECEAYAIQNLSMHLFDLYIDNKTIYRGL